jgi:4-amino-4-deoxy-L-arabinose transferase-like glycosyltransferase
VLVGLFLAAIVLGCLIAYWPSYSDSFLLDDYKHLESTRGFVGAPLDLLKVLNPYYNGWYYRPTTYWFFTIAQGLFGLRPPAFYLALLAIHTINILLVFALARRLGIGRLAALCAAAVFAITVPNQDVLGWISSVSVPLAAMFSLLAVLLLVSYLKNERENFWLLVGTAVCIVLALLSREESLILIPIVAFILLQAGVWRSPKRSELLIAVPMGIMALIYIAIIVTRPTWTVRSDVLADISSLKLLSASDLAAFLVTLASRYLLFDPAVILQFRQISWLLVLFFVSIAAIVYWKGDKTSRLGVVWWALGALFLYVFIWFQVGLAGRYLYLPWIGAALVFAAGVNRLDLDAAERPLQILVILILASFLIVQAAFARAAQRTWQEYVATTAEIEAQTKQMLPDLDTSYHLFAYSLPPVPDYVQAMASVWYGEPLKYPGGHIGRLLELGQATDKYYVLDYADGRLYNLMPELQQCEQTTFLWDAEPLAEIVDHENNRRELDEGAFELDVVKGPEEDKRFGFFLHPPAPEEGWSSLTYRTEVPEDSVLAFGLWKEWGGIEDEDGVQVRVRVRSPGLGEQTVYQADLATDKNSWTDVTVALDHYGSQEVQIELQVAAGDNFLHDHLYWANPRIVAGDGVR